MTYLRRNEELPSTTGRRYTFGGGSGVLPDTYGVKAEELADLMNDLRKRFCRATKHELEAE